MIRRPLLVLSLLAAALAAGVHALVFRDGSLNNDEVAYLLQARAIAHGHLFLPVVAPAEAHQAWFFVARPEGFVSKYLPLVSALQAVGLRLTGSVVPVLALLAALVPPVVVRLAREVGLDDRDALVATALVSLSPLVVVQSALPLSYVLFLLLVTTGWLLVLRLGLARAGAGAAALLGLVVTAGACTRPYDTLLLLGPGMLWAAWRRRRALLRLVPALAAGAVPLTAAVLAYDSRATGSALTVPFGLLEPLDALGWGLRRLVPEDPRRGFGFLQGLEGLVLHFGVDPLHWYALGALLVPGALVSWRRSGEAVRVLLASSAVMLLGYTAFWGPWNFSVLWGHGTRTLGPIYAVPLLVPAVLAGLPVVRAWSRRLPEVRLLALVAAAVAVVQLASGVLNAARDQARTQTVLAVAERGRGAGPLLLDVDPPYLGHPVSGLVGGTVLAAYAPVPPAGARVQDLLQLPRDVYRGRLTYALSHEVRAAGPAVRLQVALADRRGDVLVVERAGRTAACALGTGASVTVTTTGTTGCDDQPVPASWTGLTSRRCPDTSCLVVAVFREDGSGVLRRRAWRRLPVDTAAGSVALLTDGEPLETRGAAWLQVRAS